MVPQNLRYTKEHEWLRLEADGTVTLGITDHAQDALGDVVYVDLPDVGAQFSGNEAIGAVESVKAASDVFVPVDAEVLEINELLKDEPALVNEDCYGKGWFVRLKLSNVDDLNALLDAAAYEAFLADA